MKRVGRLLVVGLGGLLVASCATETVVTTSPVATTMASTTTAAPTTVADMTTTTSAEQRIAEITEIIREVEFGWFDAIYRKDEEALRDVVAVEEDFEVGLELMLDESFFIAEPTLDATVIVVQEVFIDREDCIAVSYYGDATAFRGDGAEGQTTVALWPRATDGLWRSAYQGDVWEEACNQYTRETQLP